jgi:hypothetical protein
MCRVTGPFETRLIWLTLGTEHWVTTDGRHPVAGGGRKITAHGSFSLPKRHHEVAYRKEAAAHASAVGVHPEAVAQSRLFGAGMQRSPLTQVVVGGGSQ